MKNNVIFGWLLKVFGLGFGAGVFLGALSGIAIGTVTGMLIAPRPGSQLRKDLCEHCSDLVSMVTSKMHQLVDKAADLRARAMQRADEAMKEFDEELEQDSAPERSVAS